MKAKELQKEIMQYLEEIKTYNQALNIISFDHKTIAPKKGIAERNNMMEQLQLMCFKKQKDERFIDLINQAYQIKDSFNPYFKCKIENIYNQNLKMQNITPELSYKYSVHANESFEAWRKGKLENDYSIYKYKLQQVIDDTIESIKLRPQVYSTNYNALLDDYEKGNTEEKLDKFFSELKEGILKILDKVLSSKKVIREDFLTNKVKIAKQEKFSLYLLKIIGFDLDAGCLSTTEHPFTSMASKNDVRVTTHYYENLFISNIFSTIHEGGHGIFAQNEPDVMFKNYLNDSMTFGMHECMSRMYENMIGRSEEFINLIYKKFSSVFRKEFKDVSEKELYEAVNVVHPSLVRTEADELTYCIHIIIRYELEKDLINQKITTEHLDEIWNQKYQEYLGVHADNYAEGLMQDVHWSDGSFGYFPSYAIGTVYAAQIMHKMKQEIDVDNLIKQNKLKEIKKWLSKNAFNNASLLDPDQWIKQITGEEINTKYYLEYLENKLSKIYNF